MWTEETPTANSSTCMVAGAWTRRSREADVGWGAGLGADLMRKERASWRVRASAAESACWESETTWRAYQRKKRETSPHRPIAIMPTRRLRADWCGLRVGGFRGR